jgi:hypothetical protein
MTLEQLLECTAAEFRSYTDEQLLEFFAPVLKVTRPSLVLQEKEASLQGSTKGTQNTSQNRQRNRGASPGSDKAKALEIAKKLGIDLGFK